VPQADSSKQTKTTSAGFGRKDRIPPARHRCSACAARDNRQSRGHPSQSSRVMPETRLTGCDLDVGEEPMQLFEVWLQKAAGSEPNDPNAVALATVDTAGLPDVRMVLLKSFDPAGFVFYTNLESTKGKQLLATRKAAM